MKNFEELARKHNESVDSFMDELKKEYGDKTPVSKWFEIQTKIKAQNFYEKGIAIVREARKNGLDFKMNMQTDKIC